MCSYRTISTKPWTHTSDFVYTTVRTSSPTFPPTYMSCVVPWPQPAEWSHGASFISHQKLPPSPWIFWDNISGCDCVHAVKTKNHFYMKPMKNSTLHMLTDLTILWGFCPLLRQRSPGELLSLFCSRPRKPCTTNCPDLPFPIVILRHYGCS